MKHFKLLTLITLSALTTPAHASDWVLDESKYTAKAYSDHLYMEVFIADLDGKNTYSKGGTVYATNGKKTISLMDLEYINQGSDGSQTAEVKARVVESNARAWFTNSQSGDQKVGTSTQSYWLTKWGSSNHYMTVKIDYYYPAELAGDTWKIYYVFKHSNGDWYTRVLKYSCTIDNSLGLSPMGTGYAYERTSPNNIKFTVSSLPNDIPSKVSDVRWRTCYYDVSYVYYRQDGSQKTVSETYECVTGQEKSYNSTIPDDVGNPKRVDINVSVRQGVRDPKDYFWDSKSFFSINKAFKSVPVPSTITTEYRQFDKAATLSWTQPVNGTYMGSDYLGDLFGDYLSCTPYVYRIETDAAGNILSGKSWSKRGSIDNTTISNYERQVRVKSFSFTDGDLQMGAYYKYMVVDVPTNWINNSVNSASLNNPGSDLLNRLGYTVSGVMSTAPAMRIYAFQQDTTVVDRVKLTWQYSRVPTDASSVNFQVLRKTNDDADWSEFGSVTGDAQPSTANYQLSIVDADLPNVSTRYQYKVRLSLLGDKYRFESNPLYAGLLSGTRLKDFEATKGTHDATVRLSWNASQIGSDNSTYVISRRYVDSEDEFMRIHTTNGTSELYTYEDNTVQPGYYYEYKIEVYSGNVLQNTLYDVGFCQARGVISGRVTFGAGDAVEDVRLTLQPSNTGEDNAVKGSSQYVGGASTGITWEADSTEMSRVFGPGKSYTVQMFVRPDDGLGEGAVIAGIPGVGQLCAGSQTDGGYQLRCKQSAGPVDTGLALPSGIFSLLTVEVGNGNVSISVNNDSLSSFLFPLSSFDTPFSVGGAQGVTETTAFKGNIAEVRVWHRLLTEGEKTAYSDRMLNGRESGLALYWPMDEGLDRYVFDASYANDMPNGRHATVGNNISASALVPADNQLSRYATTNENGEYIIRGIPFVGSGSTYTVTPTCGIHDFSPLSRNGFIGNGSLTLNSYDFTDVSSFPVRGKVTYLNTNIPVDSVQFMIDGSLVQSKEGVRSDSNGEYEISVPIGKHLIECYMNGHKFSSFPLDGSTYDFKQAETVNFVDSTLVNVTGRINGGFSDQDAPLGFNQSVNRVGKATVKLSLGRESQCSFNYIVDDRGDGSFGTENIPVASASDNIRSTAYRAGGDHDDTYYIYITTDEKTGEFSALLPPLKYKVESIKFEGGTDYDGEPVFAQNLPVIDATNAIAERMKSDTLTVDNRSQTYKYSAKMIRQYRSNPVISVRQKGMENGAFGEQVIAVTNSLTNTVDSVRVVNYTGDGCEYVYGYPLFQQGKSYEFDIDVSEHYVNLDTREAYEEIPRDAVFNMMNDGSATTTVFGEKATIEGEEVELGEAYSTLNIQVVPDEKGHISYQWEGGWPNLAEGNLRNLSIGVKVDGRTTMWHDTTHNSDVLDFIVLGGIGSGTNFVTSGPDAVDMIVRRPPGSTSVASLTSKTLTSTAHTRVDTNNGGGAGGGIFLSETPTWEVEVGNVMGIATLKTSKFKITLNQTETFNGKWWDDDASTKTDTYSVTSTMTTPASMIADPETKTFASENGDTYIGRATNLLFSKGLILGLFKQDDGTFKLEEKDGITVSQSFGTTFVYPQAYILNTLIPNWKEIIRSKLEEGHITGDHWDEANTPRIEGKIIYYTKYAPGDDEFGRANGDTDYWSASQLAATKGFPSYRMINGTDDRDVEDEVEYAINQIKLWEARIADNEQDKLEAFNNSDYLIDNFSIASGTKVSQTTETTTSKHVSHAHNYSFTWNSEVRGGVMFNDAGVNAILTGTAFDGYKESDDTTKTTSSAVAWTMSDGDLRTALSVDVYKSKKGWGPIFRTRGGQTANPYEGASYTKYYQKGTLLNEATMKVENPQLKVLGASELTDIPSGSEARFTLQLFNESETNSTCTYVLQVQENSNPNGAILTIDGMVLSNGKEGRLIKMKGGETLEKTLVVTQGDRSVTDYEDIILVLRSEKDTNIESEKVTLSVHFVPASAHVELAVDHTVLNQALKLDGITAKIFNLDRQDASLQGVRLRYRRKGTDTWTLIKQWTTIESLLTQGYEPMPEGSQFTASVTFLDDGLYELQAQTFGKYGNDDVTYESQVIEVTQDTHGPKILGMVSPEDGKLTYVHRNNMHLRFNEVLNGNALSKSDNFRIEGGMNNVVFGGNAYPDVAAQLNGQEIGTDAFYDLSHDDYAFDMWFYRQGDGTIISLGTDDNLLALSTHDDGMLRARVGGQDDVFETNVRLPNDQWTYMAMNYKRKTATDQSNRITMLYATADDASPTYVGENMPANDLNGYGKLGVGGDGMMGMVAELSVWNSDVTATELYESRNKLRASYTPGLVGYWEMDEGHGTVLADRARSRHMYMDSESWYINNENRAAHLDGSKPMRIDISTFNPAKTDNYAIEFWFRGEHPSGMYEQTLLSVLNCFNIGFQENGQDQLMLKMVEHSHQDGVEIQQVKEEYLLSDKNYNDGNWHHFALNVRRGTSAIAYVDGNAVKVIPEGNIPGISGHWMLIGGEELMDVHQGEEYPFAYNLFAGDIDEVRIWSAALDGDLIKNRMYERLDDSYAGLVGYFPMEDIHRTAQGTVTTDFSLENFGEKDSRLKLVAGDTQFPTQALNAPALKPGSTKMRLEDSQFDFTASADEIYFSFPDSSLPLMDNNDFVATVKYIKDEHGNNSETVEWLFHTDFACVNWQGHNVTDVVKAWDETVTFTEYLHNASGTQQYFEISGLPSWMTVSKAVGTVDGDSELITFTVTPNAPIGKRTEYVYLTDRLGIRRVLQVNLTVEGDVPDWSVDPNRYESNMTLTGQVYVGDRICEYTETKIAAFDDMGLCCGVAQPKYVATRDAFYVDMIVYGAAPTDLSTGQRNLTFKMYDASTGVIYPVVELTVPAAFGGDGGSQTNLTYMPDAIIGSYDEPVAFRSTDNLLQTVTLPRGWTWMSLHVQPASTAIEDVLPKSKAELKKYQYVKGKTAFASAADDGSSVLGALTDIEPGNMYKVQVSSSASLDIYGKVIDVTKNSQAIKKGYNWIGSLSGSVMSPDEAFADLQPEVGDMVKSRRAYAVYGSRGTWEGLLESIVPGEGYVYQSKADTTKTFHYPRASTGMAFSRKSPLLLESGRWKEESGTRSEGVAYYQPVDDSQFPDNMAIIAVVEKDGQRIDDAEVAAFIGGECRGAVGYRRGYYFLTVMGSSVDDRDATIELRVYHDDREYIVENEKPFVSDGAYGTLEEPYVLNLDKAVEGISSVYANDADTEWYTLQGFKIGRKPTSPGVYIHRGQTVVLTTKR